MVPPPKNSNAAPPVRKQLVRVAELPVRDGGICQSVPGRPGRSGVPSATTNEQHDKYRKPALKTTQGIRDQMQRIRDAPIPASKSVNDLTPNAQQFVQEKVFFLILYYKL